METQGSPGKPRGGMKLTLRIAVFHMMFNRMYKSPCYSLSIDAHLRGCWPGVSWPGVRWPGVRFCNGDVFQPTHIRVHTSGNRFVSINHTRYPDINIDGRYRTISHHLHNRIIAPY